MTSESTGTKILLVQRKNNTISNLRLSYETLRYETVVANSYKDAIRKLESDNSIELVLVDIQLAKETGFELLKHIKKSSRLRSIPIMMTCDACEASIMEDAIHHGASDIIVVPCADDILLEKTQKAIAQGKHVILIVDDDPVILNLLKYVIELERFKTLFASSAEEALEILSKNRVSAIISDIFLPGGQSGLELLKNVKESTNSIPVILITGNSDRVSSERAVNAGADGYIKKPFKNTEIIQTLRKVVKQT